MLPLLLLAHLIAAALIALSAPRLGRNSLAIGAVPSAVTAMWAALTWGDTPTTATVNWVPELDLVLVLSVGDLARLMTLIVSGIGTAVFVYAAGYFSPGTSGIGRFGATLMSFATAMVGLIWSDSVWALFLFWELTSITSFLLVGHKHASSGARYAARRALLITVSGGLCLLAGLVLLVDDLGTARISELGPASSAAAAVLLMVAAATKSAQFPFHVWLPGAMSAPTPVSAYLHSATMVKAGVLLVALMHPAFAASEPWRPLGIAIGTVTMFWGAIGALRHLDAKLILAWGTVSQLGLMILTLSIGTPKAAFAGLSLLVAHAIFKAALFMVVGEIDVRTGTRDVGELQGLYRSMPIATGVAVISAASMAGLPPLLGFPAKEAAIEAGLSMDGGWGTVVVLLIASGSVLTVAYSLRFCLTTFGGTGEPTPVAPRRAAMTAPAVVLAATSVIAYLAAPGVTELIRDAVVRLDDKAVVYTLYRWPGLTDAFLISLAVVVAGLVVGLVVVRAGLRDEAPRSLGAGAVDALVEGVIVVARTVARTVQHGSLPVYLFTMTLAVIAAASPFLGSIDTDSLIRWDSPAQAVLAAVIVLAAGLAATIDSRLGAALGLGAVGVSVSGLFVVNGAPDLALTQLLVETVVVVGFVVGLGTLGLAFPRIGAAWRTVRIVSALVAAAAITGAFAAAGSDRVAPPEVEDLTSQSVSEGGGNNVVNVILTDLRALDTLGEVIVLLLVSLGVIALGRAGHDQPGAGGSVIRIDSPTLRQAVVATTPLALVVALFVLFAGHNRPGGGFAAGLIAGAVVALRAAAGLGPRIPAVSMLAVGGLIAIGTAVAPLLGGDPLLDMVVVETELAVLGKVKSGSALIFDIGVLLIVVGMVAAVLEGLGALDDADAPREAVTP